MARGAVHGNRLTAGSDGHPEAATADDLPRSVVSPEVLIRLISDFINAFITITLVICIL